MRFFTLCIGYMLLLIVITSICIPITNYFLPHIDFSKMASRVMLIVAIILLLPFIKYSNITYQKLGYNISIKKAIKPFILSMVMGVFSIFFIHLIQYLWGARFIENNMYLSIFLKAFLSGIFVALIEETLFRGLLYGAIEKKYDYKLAIFITAFLYSLVHFFKVSTEEFDVVSWKSGILVWQNIYNNVTSGQIISSFLALWALGIFLALMRKHYGHIIHCLGFHCGAVFMIKLATKFTDSIREFEYTWFVKGDISIGNYMTLCLIVLLIIGFVSIKGFPKKTIRQKENKNFTIIWFSLLIFIGVWITQIHGTIFYQRIFFFYNIEKINNKTTSSKKTIPIKREHKIEIEGFIIASREIENVFIRFAGQDYIANFHLERKDLESRYNQFAKKFHPSTFPVYEKKCGFNTKIKIPQLPAGTYVVFCKIQIKGNSQYYYPNQKCRIKIE